MVNNWQIQIEVPKNRINNVLEHLICSTQLFDSNRGDVFVDDFIKNCPNSIEGFRGE